MNDNINTISLNQEEFTMKDAEEAAKRLFEDQVNDFYALKKERWYKRFINAITFRTDGKKKIIKDIRTLGKLQAIFIRVYCEHYKTLDSQLNEIIDNLSKTNETVKKLYENYIVGVQSQQSVLEMSSLEQDIVLLLICNYRSINGNEEILKKYRAGLANTIGKGLPDGEFKPELLREISKGDICYRIILEMCAIDGGLADFSVPDNIYEAINYLSISSITKQELEEQICKELDCFGEKYLVNKYGVAEDDLFDENIVLEDVDAVIVIDKDISIEAGSSKKFLDKEVHVRANIICSGELVFENCTIVYNDTAVAAGIKITTDGKLTITGSTIKSLSYKENFFCESCGNIDVENCKIVDCAFLLMASNILNITGCKFVDCAGGIVAFEGDNNSKVSICNNVINQRNLKPFYCNNEISLKMPMIGVYADDAPRDNFQFNNNIIKESAEFSRLFEDNDSKFIYIRTDVLTITQSSFIKMTGKIIAKKISECYFLRCDNSIESYREYYLLWESISVDNCIFENCENIITCGKNSIISKCQFVSCNNNLIYGKGADIIVADCSFKNITSDGIIGSLTFLRDSGPKGNRVENCIFNGVKMKKASLIRSASNNVRISDCNFSHCEIEGDSKDLISGYGVRITHCDGIDKFNSEEPVAVDTSINFTSTYGRKIGCDNSLLHRAGISIV